MWVCVKVLSLSLSRYRFAYRLVSEYMRSVTWSSNMRRKNSTGDFPSMSGITPGLAVKEGGDIIELVVVLLCC